MFPRLLIPFGYLLSQRRKIIQSTATRNSRVHDRFHQKAVQPAQGTCLSSFAVISYIEQTGHASALPR
jgi:hypothetical protein